MNKIVIIGCGNVGMSYAYSLLNQSTPVNELVLIDINQDKIIGEVMDLNHCLAFSPSKIDIKVGTYEDCKDATIVCIAAGANQNPGETRMDLIYKNSNAVIKYIIGIISLGIVVIVITKIIKKTAFYTDGYFKDEYLMSALCELDYYSESHNN